MAASAARVNRYFYLTSVSVADDPVGEDSTGCTSSTGCVTLATLSSETLSSDAGELGVGGVDALGVELDHVFSMADECVVWQEYKYSSSLPLVYPGDRTCKSLAWLVTEAPGHSFELGTLGRALFPELVGVSRVEWFGHGLS